MSETEITIEELHARKYRQSTTPADEKTCCPMCGSERITTRTGKYGDERTWYCRTCYDHFDEPITVAERDNG